jgi:apolipoprotein N-acyltransferase
LRFSPDYLLALLAGALLALSFPKYGHPAVGWIALAPLFIALSGWFGRPGHTPGQPARRAFALGLVAGTTYFVGTLYWTATVVQQFGGVPLPLAIVGMLLLGLYQGFFPAIAALITARLVVRAGAAALLLAPAPGVATEIFRG